MAIMIPKTFIPAQDLGLESRLGDGAESKVYSILQELDDGHVVYHSYKTAKSEIDFIIIHPNKPLTFLEVKSGLFGQSGTHIFRVKNDGSREIFDPVSKFYENKKLFIEHIKKTFRIDLSSKNFLFYLTMPKKQFLERVNGDIGNKLLIGADVNAENISKILSDSAYSANRLSKEEFLLLKSHFEEELLAKPYQKLEWALDIKEQIENKTKEIIEEELEKIFENEKISIQGPAGSAKTLLLTIFAKKQANLDRTKKVLITCYNELLEKQLTKEVADFKNIQVLNYHNLCRSMIKKTSKKADLDKLENAMKADPEKTKAFYDEHLPRLMNESLEEVAKKEIDFKFDSLFVDEAQDFKEVWANILLKIVREGSKILVVSDPLQNFISKSSETLLTSKITYKLSKNVRNTKNINRYASQFYLKAAEKIGVEVKPLTSPETYEDGVDVVEANAANYEQAKKILHEWLRELTEEQNFTSDKITLLVDVSHSMLDNENFELRRGTKIGGEYLLVQNPGGKNMFQIETGRRFKGRENLVIISIETKKETEQDFKYRYVTYTRAMTRLMVLRVG